MRCAAVGITRRESISVKGLLCIFTGEPGGNHVTMSVFFAGNMASFKRGSNRSEEEEFVYNMLLKKKKIYLERESAWDGEGLRRRRERET